MIGPDVHTLDAGDAIYFDSTVRHGYRRASLVRQARLWSSLHLKLIALMVELGPARPEGRSPCFASLSLEVAQRRLN